jgi:hypothetical protein
MSVVDYYYEKYDIVLQNVNLPALQAGTDTKLTYLPMEVVLLLLDIFFPLFCMSIMSFISVYERFFFFFCFAAL